MEHTNATTAGKSIVRYLETRGIRQTWLARQMGMNAVMMNRTLHGTAGYAITRDQVIAAADALDVPAATRREWLALLNSSSSNAA